MKPEYDDAMARARAALAVFRRTAAELSRADATADVTTALRHLRDDLHRQDAPSVARPARR
ncbi:hypothetical protein ACJH6J_15810 [Mycobacterium sp. SMC-18]|uniref:hypothetical protein n=1 Tax=Mycobacterium sp. SMC-18 TaxID=3381629 RepID=UPI0038761BE7